MVLSSKVTAFIVKAAWKQYMNAALVSLLDISVINLKINSEIIANEIKLLVFLSLLCLYYNGTNIYFVILWTK